MREQTPAFRQLNIQTSKKVPLLDLGVTGWRRFLREPGHLLLG